MSESMTCCPLSDCGERATIYDTNVRTARKDYACFECNEVIPAKAKYERISILFDGSWDSFKLCLSCREIGDHFNCGGGRELGSLWTELEQNFFPDMKAGGVCMDGLSPEAKARLFELRLKWMFDSEIEIDGALPPGFTVDRGGMLVPPPERSRTALFGTEKP